MDCSPPGSSVHGDSPAAAPKGNKKSTENKSKAHVPLQPESAARSGALREANWAPSCLLNGTRCRQRPRVSAPVCHVTLSQPLPISGVLGVHELSPQCLLHRPTLYWLLNLLVSQRDRGHSTQEVPVGSLLWRPDGDQGSAEALDCILHLWDGLSFSQSIAAKIVMSTDK